MKLNNESPFWIFVKGKPIIYHSKLIEFLNQNGFAKLKVNTGSFVLVRRDGYFVEQTSETDLIQFINDYLKRRNEYHVLEVFTRGVGQILSQKKLNLLKVIGLINDKDSKNSSTFYFSNTIVKVTLDSVNELSYKSLKKTIWKDRLLKGKFKYVSEIEQGQFYNFCFNVCRRDKEIFATLCSLIGYSIHRNRARGEDIAVIFYDDNMGNGTAEGGTGKTLLTQALGKVREVVEFSGKGYKFNSNFKNQRINLATDIVVYDDVDKNLNLENFFSQITSGLEIEQKRKDSYYIQKENMPKYIFTSNYYIKGPGGNSDDRRRFEFVFDNYYKKEFTPADEFGNRFFTQWNNDEWNLFYNFLIHCIQVYLNNGLINYEFKNLNKERIKSKLSKSFIEFASMFIEKSAEYDKRELEKLYKEYYTEKISPHMFFKYCRIWANEKGLSVETQPKGGRYMIRFAKKS